MVYICAYMLILKVHKILNYKLTGLINLSFSLTDLQHVSGLFCLSGNFFK